MNKFLTYRASNMARRYLCPGSGWAEEAPSDLPEQSRDSEEGTLMHKHMNGVPEEEAKKLSPSQVGDLAKTKRLEASITSQVFAGMDAPKAPVREKALKLFDDDMKVLITGTPDVVVRNATVGLVMDFKFGPDPVTPAEANFQLATYAVAVADLYELETVYAAIIQPRGFHGAHASTLAQYGPDQIADARRRLKEVIAASEASDAPRRPSLDACKYCRARGSAHCPETQHAVTTHVAQFLPDDPDAMKNNAKEIITKQIQTLNAVELGRLLDDGRFVSIIYAAAQDIAKTLLSRGEPVDNYSLTPGDNVYKIHGSEFVFAAFMRAGEPYGIKTADVIACFGPRIKDLEEMWKRVTGQLIAADVIRKQVETIIGPYGEYKQNASELKRFNPKGRKPRQKK